MGAPSDHDLLPHASISASALSCIAGSLASGAGGGVQLRLSFSTTSTFQLAALLQPADPLLSAAATAQPHSGGEVARVTCALVHDVGSDGGAEGVGDRVVLESAGGGDQALSARLAAGLETQGAARISEVIALSLCAAPASGTRAAPMLLGRIALPGCGVLITPLFTKRLCSTPLAEALLRPGRMAPGSTGFLSLDQARSLVPLEAADENVHTTPLVGMWVKGPDSPLHPLVAAACLKYYYASTLLDRAHQEDGSFLLLLCPEGQPVSRCYEVRSTEPGRLPLTTYSLAADLEPARQLERHPSGLVPLGWAADARCPPPLSLPPHHHQQLSAASTDMRRSQPSPGGDAIGGSRGMTAVRPSSGPPTLPWYEGRGGGGSPVTLHGLSQPLQQGADAAGPAGLSR
ncbi:putative SCL-interrupting locus like protein [Monoraphidium neglectum]|uniref:Putative SCL-interrupting locus like protein n=1 Tax=Monoraphidium neglectum TaxID=145388 RepID=A0A0D2MR05_9CHLO|nr:putative SCL-interrupting locus like protein [Monoraphidium neglectum]KIZ02862.1 putative SCL-interrupting locus like protein [Monoraphidium neglectum]|eukprot:XP_013901881.1 putative SCL-interrupting locus like protein [Monoraphidium neglectum]